METMDALRDKAIERGFDKLTEAELLALLTGSMAIGETLIARYNSIRGLADRPLEEFLAIKGLGDARILRLAAAYEIARRCVEMVIA